MTEEWIGAREANAIAGKRAGSTWVFYAAKTGRIRRRPVQVGRRMVYLYHRHDVEVAAGVALPADTQSVLADLERMAQEFPGLPGPVHRAAVGDFVQAADWSEPREVLQANRWIAVTRAPAGYMESHHHDELTVIEGSGRRVG